MSVDFASAMYALPRINSVSIQMEVSCKIRSLLYNQLASRVKRAFQLRARGDETSSDQKKRKRAEFRTGNVFIGNRISPTCWLPDIFGPCSSFVSVGFYVIVYGAKKLPNTSL